VDATIRLLEEIEVRALLAAGGDSEALAAIRRLLAELRALRAELRGQIGNQQDEDGGR
jgi:hypothetical protein